jgi:2,3-bisphosphoglycerate-independent phosphoglycerate mutase
MASPGSNTASSPLVLAILDGVGLEDPTADNAVTSAAAPFLLGAIGGQVDGQPVISLPIHAHGVAVGLPTDADMGNSEVGHNIMGAGRIFDQGAKQVEEAFRTGDIWGETWQMVMARQENQIHFVGLLSDGNVHSHIRHLKALVTAAATSGARKIVIHPLFDGRDVIDGTAEAYLADLEAFLAETASTHRCSAVVGSGGGRMIVTMDRYEADWTIVENGWKAHAQGSARPFPSASAALAALRAEDSGVSDQYLPPFTVVDESGEPVGAMNDNDAVVIFNFRGDRVVEIYRALTEEPFTPFARGPLPNNLLVVGMTLYDGDLGIPAHFLVPPTRVTGTVSELLATAGIAQYAVAETQKFGHVTYFWNGNRSEKFNAQLETWEEIPSDNVSFDKLPKMKAKETGDAVITAIESGKYPFIRCNFAGGDMVGHTGDIPASIIAVEAIDEALIRVNAAVKAAKGTLLITADHGNCEVLIERDKNGAPLLDTHGVAVPKKSHTLSPVPFIAIDYSNRTITTGGVSDAGISNVAATILALMGQPIPADYRPALLSVS